MISAWLPPASPQHRRPLRSRWRLRAGCPRRAPERCQGQGSPGFIILRTHRWRPAISKARDRCSRMRRRPAPAAATSCLPTRPGNFLSFCSTAPRTHARCLASSAHARGVPRRGSSLEGGWHGPASFLYQPGAGQAVRGAPPNVANRLVRFIAPLIDLIRRAAPGSANNRPRAAPSHFPARRLSLPLSARSAATRRWSHQPPRSPARAAPDRPRLSATRRASTQAGGNRPHPFLSADSALALSA